MYGLVRPILGIGGYDRSRVFQVLVTSLRHGNLTLAGLLLSKFSLHRGIY